jgi:xylose isomerase
VKECEANIATVRSMLRIIEKLDGNNQLDAVATQAIVQNAMFGTLNPANSTTTSSILK